MHATIGIGSNRVYQALVKVSSEVILFGRKLTEALLLSDSPGLTDVLLEEIASEEEMDGLNVDGANVKAIAKELIHADVFPGLALRLRLITIRLHRWFVFQQVVRDLAVPTKLASRKEKDIAQSRVKGMIVSNPLKGWTTLPIENDVLSVSRMITISWKKDSNLLDGSIRRLIATPVSGLVKSQGYTALLVQRHVRSQL